MFDEIQLIHNSNLTWLNYVIYVEKNKYEFVLKMINIIRILFRDETLKLKISLDININTLDNKDIKVEL